MAADAYTRPSIYRHGLDTLPLELLDDIISYIPNTELAALATVCKSITLTVERYSFKKLSLNRERLAAFSELVTQHRFSSLRRMTYRLQDCTIAATYQDQCALSRDYVVTELNHLFGVFADSERRLGCRGHFELEVKITESAIQSCPSSSLAIEACRPSRCASLTAVGTHLKSPVSKVDRYLSQLLPIYAIEAQNLAAISMSHEADYAEDRDDLARTISTLPASLKKLDWFLWESPLGIDPRADDPLTNSLRSIMTRLVRLHLVMSIDPCLLFQACKNADYSQRRYLHLDLLERLPDGTNLFSPVDNTHARAFKDLLRQMPGREQLCSELAVPRSSAVKWDAIFTAAAHMVPACANLDFMHIGAAPFDDPLFGTGFTRRTCSFTYWHPIRYAKCTYDEYDDENDDEYDDMDSDLTGNPDGTTEDVEVEASIIVPAGDVDEFDNAVNDGEPGDSEQGENSERSNDSDDGGSEDKFQGYKLRWKLHGVEPVRCGIRAAWSDAALVTGYTIRVVLWPEERA